MSGRLFSRSLAPLEPSGHVAEPGLTTKQLHWLLSNCTSQQSVATAKKRWTIDQAYPTLPSSCASPWWWSCCPPGDKESWNDPQRHLEVLEVVLFLTVRTFQRSCWTWTSLFPSAFSLLFQLFINYLISSQPNCWQHPISSSRFCYHFHQQVSTNKSTQNSLSWSHIADLGLTHSGSIGKDKGRFR